MDTALNHGMHVTSERLFSFCLHPALPPYSGHAHGHNSQFFYKETFVTEVEVLREEMRETELIVEGQFATEADMVEWGFSEQFGMQRVKQ